MRRGPLRLVAACSFVVSAWAQLGRMPSGIAPPVQPRTHGSNSGNVDPLLHRPYNMLWLEHVLARPATVSAVLSPYIGSDQRVANDTTDLIRMLRNTGVRYAGRTAWVWGHENLLPQMLPEVKQRADKVHAALPEIVLEAAVFEIVTDAVTALQIPPHVFEAFELPVESRTFNYTAMLFPNDANFASFINMFGPNMSVPDLTQLESRLWFYYAATSWISQGIEAMHCGQIMLMSARDDGMVYTTDLFTKIRSFARATARRGFVLLNAHAYQDPYVHFNGTSQLIFDFHAFPSRPVPVPSQPEHCVLQLNASNNATIYGHSAGGRSITGWYVTSLPYLVELDNYDCTNIWRYDDIFHPYGYDEISWFAHQPVAYRNKWIYNSAQWLWENDPSGNFEMPLMRCLCDPNFFDRELQDFFDASSEAKTGFHLEDAVKQTWQWLGTMQSSNATEPF